MGNCTSFWEDCTRPQSLIPEVSATQLSFRHPLPVVDKNICNVYRPFPPLAVSSFSLCVPVAVHFRSLADLHMGTHSDSSKISLDRG